MWIRNLVTAPRGGGTEVAAEVDGYRLWYRVPASYPVARSADPFLAAALLPAMARGERLEVEPALPVSPRLLANVFRLQEIFHTWNPVLKIVPVTAGTAPAGAANKGTLSFFSGGVDSTYTFLKHRGEITHLAFIHGFDFYDVPESFRIAADRNARFAAAHGKKLIPVETNHHPFGYRYALSRNLTQGSALAAVALLLGFAVNYIPSSRTYRELSPLGSHPLTDPLWSNEAIEIIHDGSEARRTDKLRRIAASDAALANLRVCFTDMNVNCGRCAKCLRTMIPLTLLGAAAAPFPPLPPLGTLARAEMGTEIERDFFRENVELAMTTNAAEHRELRETLRRRLRRAELRRVVRDLDHALLGGRVRRMFVRAPRVFSISSAPDQ